MFSINRSSYKYWRKRPDEINTEKVKLHSIVREAHAISNGSAGARTIATVVTTMGAPLTRYRATKVMKVLGLVSCQLPKHRYKKASQDHVEIPNYLARQFTVTAPNDVTYIWVGNRWAYLTVVLDLFARKPVGWALSRSPNSELTGKALIMSFESRGKPTGVLFHSDQGSHYTSRKYRQLLWPI